jgi:signal peptidase II
MNATSASVAASESGIRWLPLALVVITLDQLTKRWAVGSLFEYQRIEILPVFDITLRYNTGAAFSFLAGQSGWQRWFFVGLAIMVAIGIIIWLRQLPARTQALLSSGLAMILGGALGNVIDRLYLGKVVDFILVYWNTSEFPAFNVADSAITIGAALILIDAIRESRRARPTPSA